MSATDPAGEAPSDTTPGRITVIAGVNGAGKSSIVGALLRRRGGDYFNPDEYARRLRADDPGVSVAEANAYAWEFGRQALAHAIAAGRDYTFETTLGGRTIADMLADALERGREVVVHYVGLDAPERHIARVHERVTRGGHDIPEAKIRERYVASREHLIALLPRLTTLVVYDNSAERDPATGQAPTPTRVLDMVDGRIQFVLPPNRVPAWAKPLAAAALVSDVHPHPAQAEAQPADPPDPGAPPGLQPDIG